MNWQCERCEGVSIADLQRAGAYSPPDDPAAKCSGCGVPLAPAFRSALILERLVAQEQPAAGVASVVPPRPADTTAPARRRTANGSGLLSARAASTRLGVNRSTLARLVAQGGLVAVPKGSRRGYRTADVEALIERGFTLDGPAPAPPPRKRVRRRAPKSTDASIAARLAEF